MVASQRARGGMTAWTESTHRPSFRSRRRNQAMIGAVGLLSILGMAGLVSNAMTEGRDAGSTPQPGAPAPTPGVDSAAATPRTAAERIAGARSAAANASSQVRRQPPRKVDVAGVGEATVKTFTVHEDGESLKTASARQDLTGYRELGWVVDEGEPAGSARCTQKVRLSTGVAARDRPTLLLCWRTSAHKSVYTVAVKLGGRPSMKDSAAAIDKEWANLG